MKKLLLPLLFVLNSCNQFPAKPYRNSELMEVVNVVLNEANKRSKYFSVEDVTIDFADLQSSEKGVVGICEIGEDIKIFIDRKNWIEDPKTREQIMAHEMGHCLMGLDHDDSFKNNRPTSLMNSYVIKNSIFIQYRQYYYDELFLNH